MKLFLFEIEDNKQPFPTKLLDYISEERKQQIEKYKHTDSKLCSLYAALLTRMVLCKEIHCSNDELVFSKTQKGKPILTSHPDWKFNFSHSGQMILLGIEKHQEIGIDIEKPRKYSESVVKKCLHPSELALFQQLPDTHKETAFFEFWTQKEAFSKQVGKGLSLSFETINTTDKSTKEQLYHWQYKEYICSVSAKKLPKHLPEVTTITQTELEKYYLKSHSVMSNM